MIGGLHAYKVSEEIYSKDYPISALLMAAMRGADTENLAKLKHSWPELYAELQERYNAPGGKLESDK